MREVVRSSDLRLLMSPLVPTKGKWVRRSPGLRANVGAEKSSEVCWIARGKEADKYHRAIVVKDVVRLSRVWRALRGREGYLSD